MFWMNIISVVIEKTEIYCATSRKSLIPVYSASNSNSLASLIYIHHDFFGQIQKKSTIQQFWISPLALLATSQNPERRRHIYARGPGLRIVIFKRRRSARARPGGDCGENCNVQGSLSLHFRCNSLTMRSSKLLLSLGSNIKLFRDLQSRMWHGVYTCI
jgi:hypothetical protein